MERFCGSLVVAEHGGEISNICLAHRVRDFSLLSIIKVQYGLIKELDSSERSTIVSSGQPQHGCKYQTFLSKHCL